MDTDEVMAEVISVVPSEYFRRERRRGLRPGSFAMKHLTEYPVKEAVRVWCPLCHGMRYAFVENLKAGITRCNGCGVRLKIKD